MAGKRRRNPSGELLHRTDRPRISVDGRNLVSLAKKKGEVAAAATSRIHQPLSRNDATPLDLVEQIDVHLAEERSNVNHDGILWPALALLFCDLHTLKSEVGVKLPMLRAITAAE